MTLLKFASLILLCLGVTVTTAYSYSSYMNPPRSLNPYVDPYYSNPGYRPYSVREPARTYNGYGYGRNGGYGYGRGGGYGYNGYARPVSYSPYSNDSSDVGTRHVGWDYSMPRRSYDRAYRDYAPRGRNYYSGGYNGYRSGPYSPMGGQAMLLNDVDSRNSASPYRYASYAPAYGRQRMYGAPGAGVYRNGYNSYPRNYYPRSSSYANQGYYGRSRPSYYNQGLYSASNGQNSDVGTRYVSGNDYYMDRRRMGGSYYTPRRNYGGYGRGMDYYGSRRGMGGMGYSPYYSPLPNIADAPLSTQTVSMSPNYYY